MLIGFDWDGTLVERWTASPLPGVETRLAALPQGAHTFVATNQAGPVLRAVLGDPRYPTVEDLARRITDGFSALDWWPDLLMVCVHPGRHDQAWRDAAMAVSLELRDALAGRWLEPSQLAVYAEQDYYRKPKPGMLHSASGFFGQASIAGMLYIGDMDTDRAAATAAGCPFLDAAQWRTAGLP